MEQWTRRKFFLTTVAGGIAAGARRLWGSAGSGDGTEGAWQHAAASPSGAAPAKAARPLIISAANGFPHLGHGMTVLKKGGDTLDAVLAVVTRVEDDPNDTSVGYGGLPNEDGIVELDASVMHGPTRLAGAVGALRNIKNPCLVAKAVMQRTDHIFLVGEGALRFARDQGFEEMNLLTEQSRTAWLAWKAATASNWSPSLGSPEWKAQMVRLLDTPEKMAWSGWIEEVVAHPTYGTINCLALNQKGDISGVTTTSGLSWKIAGRVGDSPIIGAGLYVDNDVGAAGSTGRGEENIRVSGAHTIVEMMRKGLAPTDACLEALKRIVRNYSFDKPRLNRFYVVYYALNKDGVHGGASLWTSDLKGRRFNYAVHDGAEARLVPCTPLLEGQGGD